MERLVRMLEVAIHVTSVSFPGLSWRMVFGEIPEQRRGRSPTVMKQSRDKNFFFQ